MQGKILLIRRKYVAALALALAVIAMFYIINHPRLIGDAATGRFLPIYSIGREDQAISLTFNITGIEDEHTDRVKEILNEHEIKATFFVTGDWVEQNEELAIKLVTSGHELMNLGNDYRPRRQMSQSERQANIKTCSEAIQAVTGAHPTIFRAPYGQYDDRLIASVRELGMHTVQWSIDSGDRRTTEPETITRQVLNRAASGGIVLLHSDLAQSVKALPEILEGLAQAGYSLVPLSQLMLQTEYTISLTGRQIPA